MSVEVLESPSKTDNVYGHNVILFNDDVNSMDDVFVSVLKHCSKTPEEAYQIVMKAHNEGKTSCYSGSFEECETVQDALVNDGLTAEVV